MFHTPPINNMKFDSSQAIKESYHLPTEDSLNVLSDLSNQSSNASSNSNTGLTKEEIEQEVESIISLPSELSKLIDLFIDDLKQPKYLRPLSVVQLSSLFQSFYIKFDRSSFQYLTRQANEPANTLLNARESLSSGLSGIFNRSRSGSGTRKRSSSLFSTDSNNAFQPLLTPEEINKQLRNNELNNLKIERYMKLCEHDVFHKILEVGTSVPGNNNHKPSRTLKVTNLFRNSPEFIEFDKLLNEKLITLTSLAAHGKLDLTNFLAMSQRDTRVDGLWTDLEKLVYDSIAPHEKLQYLLKLHDDMMTFNHTSNDDFLSTLIYLIIHQPVKNIFLNVQFIKLFRYKKKLIEKELYALTNLEAALTFVQSLTVADLPEDTKGKLSQEERKILDTAITNKVALPEVKFCGESSAQHPGLPRSNSYKDFESGFKTVSTALDSSLRNIFGKIRSYTPPAQVASSINNSQVSLSVAEDGVKKNLSIPTSWKQFKNRQFEELKVTELKQLFENYQNILNALDD